MALAVAMIMFMVMLAMAIKMMRKMSVASLDQIWPALTLSAGLAAASATSS